MKFVKEGLLFLAGFAVGVVLGYAVSCDCCGDCCDWDDEDEDIYED